MHTRDKQTKRVVFVFASTLFILLAIFFCFVDKLSTSKSADHGGNGIGESRTVSTNKAIDETKATPPLQIDDVVAKKLNSLGYSTNVAPIKVVGGEDSNK